MNKNHGIQMQDTNSIRSINTPEMKQALKLPLRSKTRRKSENTDQSGVLIFAKKGNDFVFK